MNKYLKLLKIHRLPHGFTLTELLFASAMTVAVLGGAGYGLLAVLNSDKIANANSQTQQMLNLGVEFVGDEIQSATQIDSAYDASTAAQFESIRNASDIPVLSLKISGLSQRVIYYTRDMSAEKNPTWAGPTVLYRFGPYVDTNGNYLNPTDPTKWGNGDALIDLIGSRQNLTDANASTACSDTSWTRMPAQDADLRGFFVCVRPKGDLAEIRALSAMDMKGTKTSGNKPVPYLLTTQVATRSIENPDLDGDGAILDPITMKPNMPVNIVGTAIYKTPSCYAPKDSDIGIVADAGAIKVASISQPLGATNDALIQVGVPKGSPCSYDTYQQFGLAAKNGDTLSSLIAKANPAYKGTNSQRAATITNLEQALGSTYFDSTTKTIKLPTNQNLFFMSNNATATAAKPQTYDYAIILTTVTRQ